jgi:hypothetical protein
LRLLLGFNALAIGNGIGTAGKEPNYDDSTGQDEEEVKHMVIRVPRLGRAIGKYQRSAAQGDAEDDITQR